MACSGNPEVFAGLRAAPPAAIDFTAAAESSAASSAGEPGERGRGCPGRSPGSGGGVPKQFNHNVYHWADHAFFTMDHIDDCLHTREVLREVMQQAFGLKDCRECDQIRGIAVREPHATTGGYHLQGAVLCGKYHGPRAILDRARRADQQERGFKREPEWEQKEVRAGGKGRGRQRSRNERKEGTGEAWHLNLLFCHEYAAGDKEVLAGKKKAGTKRAAWCFNDMVTYLTEPSKDKEVDEEPLWINCTADTVWRDEPEAIAALPVPDLVQYARSLKAQGVREGDAHQLVASKSPGQHVSEMSYAMHAYRSSETEAPAVYVPEVLREGHLLGARPIQIMVCSWLEDGPCREACGLYLQGPPRAGKTTLAKLLEVRYPKQVYIAEERAADGGFDRTALMQYDSNVHRIIWFNDIKGKTAPGGRTIFPRRMDQLFREITDGAPLRFNFCGKSYSISPLAKVIINSTQPPPDDPEFRRRYLCVASKEDGSYDVLNSQLMAQPGTAEDGCYVRPRDDLEPAAESEILASCYVDNSIEWKTFLLKFGTLFLFEAFLAREFEDAAAERPSASLAELQDIVFQKYPQIDEAITCERDRDHLGSRVVNVGFPLFVSNRWKTFVLLSGSAWAFRRSVKEKLEGLRNPPPEGSTPMEWLQALLIEWREAYSATDGPDSTDADTKHLRDIVFDWWGKRPREAPLKRARLAPPTAEAVAAEPAEACGGAVPFAKPTSKARPAPFAKPTSKAGPAFFVRPTSKAAAAHPAKAAAAPPVPIPESFRDAAFLEEPDEDPLGLGGGLSYEA